MKHLVLIAVVIFFSLTVVAQKPSSSPVPKEVRLSIPALKDELSTSEVEPRLGKFRMNARFIRARFSTPTGPDGASVRMYVWDYYPEATVLLKFFQVPAGTFPKTEPELQRVMNNLLDGSVKTDLKSAELLSAKDIKVDGEIGREARVIYKGRPTTVRGWSRDDIWYLMLAISKKDDAQPVIEKLFSSFQFVR